MQNIMNADKQFIDFKCRIKEERNVQRNLKKILKLRFMHKEGQDGRIQTINQVAVISTKMHEYIKNK